MGLWRQAIEEAETTARIRTNETHLAAAPIAMCRVLRDPPPRNPQELFRRFVPEKI